jgi:type I restriction enzyme S subunit
MKAGWVTKKLGEVCRFIDYRGRTPEKTESGLRLITAKNVKMGFLQRHPVEFVNPDSYEGWMTRGIPKMGDVLFTTEAPLANVAQLDTDERVVFAQRIVILQPTGPNLDRTFLKYLLVSGSVQQRIHHKGTGATVKGIKASLLKNIEIGFPPLPEQQRIVGILDEAFDGIAGAKANAEKNLRNARALFESHLQAVFTQQGKGWVETTIGQHIRFIDYRGRTPKKTESGLRLITAKNVKMGYLQETPMEFVAPESYDGWMTRGIPWIGDVLFTTEAPLANVAQLDTDEKVVFAQRIIIMQPNASKLDNTFLKYLLLSQSVQERIRTKGTGATVQGIKARLLKTIEISFPSSLAQQQQIVAKLDSLRDETQRLESIYQQKLDALEALKQSLLYQAFNGEL